MDRNNLEYIPIQSGKQVKRTKIEEPVSENYINIKISKNKLREAMVKTVLIISAIAAIKFGAGIYMDYREEEQRKQDVLEHIIESDQFLSNLVVYTSDSGFEIWEKNESIGRQQPVSIEEVEAHITTINLTEEEEEIVRSQFGINENVSHKGKN